MKKYLYIFIVGIFFLPATLQAQYEPGRFKKFTAADGLSDNIISCISQDERGFIWVGTLSGLNRFDGRIFDKFYNTADTTSVSGSWIRHIKKFAGSQLGIISTKGFSVLNTNTLKAKRFNVPDTTRLWLNSNSIFDAAELPGGDVAFTGGTGFYVSNASGQLKYRYENFTVKDIEEIKKRIFFGNTIFPVSDNDYLLYYQDTRLGNYNYSKNKLTLSPADVNAEWNSFLVPQESWTIKKQLNRDEYLFLSFINDSITYYNYKTGLRKSTHLPVESRKSFYWDSYMCTINDSTFAINCDGKGFYIFSLNRLSGGITMNTTLQLPQYKCTALFCDREGRLWVGTSEGLLMYKKALPEINAVSTVLPADSHKYEIENNCIFKYNNKLFIGRYSYDNGLSVYDAITKRFIRTVNFYKGNNRFNGIFSIQCYHPDTLWVSTENGVLWLNTNNYSYGSVDLLNRYHIFPAQLCDTSPGGKAWIFRYGSDMVLRYNVHSRSCENVSSTALSAGIVKGIKHAVRDSYGNTWFAGYGLCRWNEVLQKIDTVISRFAGNYPLENRVSCMTADNKGSLWLVVVDNGLLEYRISEKKWIVYNNDPLIPQSLIGTFSPVMNDRLWFSSGTSLHSLNIVNKKIAAYGEAAGFPSKNTASNGEHYYFDRSENKMYLAVADFFTEIPSVNDSVASPDQLFIKQIILNNEKVINFPGDSISISYKENQLAIIPGIIEFEPGGIYQYEYKLDNEANWNQLGASPSVFLYKLSAGEHRVSIRVSGLNKGLNEKTILITIRPPFWKTRWFYGISLLLITGLLFFGYKLRVKNIRRKALINQRLAEFEMKALHAQMNPHFIFNCLNSIKGLIINNRNREAAEYLTKFSQLVRLNLEQSRRQTISLQEVIEYLKKYIEIETLRYDQLNWSVTVDENLPVEDIPIAPMLLQPLVENAIWHGLLETKGEKMLQLGFRNENETIICTIGDNGVGYNHSMSMKHGKLTGSVGLQNIQERIALLNEKFGMNYQLTIVDKADLPGAGTGTLATLSFHHKIFSQ